MTDGVSACRLSGLLQEVAEGLQSAGSCLGAARRISSQSEHASTAYMIDKAAGEIVRAQIAFHRLRDHLRSDCRYEKDATNTPAQTGAVLPVIGRERSEKSRG